jgi:Trp operon repressor
MARIIVTPDEHNDVVLLDENVYPVHLDNEISSRQVAERLAWAVSDAEATERAGSLRRRPAEDWLHVYG